MSTAQHAAAALLRRTCNDGVPAGVLSLSIRPRSRKSRSRLSRAGSCPAHPTGKLDRLTVPPDAACSRDAPPRRAHHLKRSLRFLLLERGSVQRWGYPTMGRAPMIRGKTAAAAGLRWKKGRGLRTCGCADALPILMCCERVKGRSWESCRRFSLAGGALGKQSSGVKGESKSKCAERTVRGTAPGAW